MEVIVIGITLLNVTIWLCSYLLHCDIQYLTNVIANIKEELKKQ